MRLELRSLILFLQDGNYHWLTCWHKEGVEGWSPRKARHMKDKIMLYILTYRISTTLSMSAASSGRWATCDVSLCHQEESWKGCTSSERTTAVWLLLLKSGWISGFVFVELNCYASQVHAEGMTGCCSCIFVMSSLKKKKKKQKESSIVGLDLWSICWNVSNRSPEGIPFSLWCRFLAVLSNRWWFFFL